MQETGIGGIANLEFNRSGELLLVVGLSVYGSTSIHIWEVEDASVVAEIGYQLPYKIDETFVSYKRAT